MVDPTTRTGRAARAGPGLRVHGLHAICRSPGPDRRPQRAERGAGYRPAAHGSAAWSAATMARVEGERLSV